MPLHRMRTVLRVGPFEVRRKTTDVNSILSQLEWAADQRAGDFNVGNVYETIAWVAIVIDAVGQNFSRAPFRIYRGDTEQVSGPAYDLFRAVNPQMSQSQLFQATVSWRWYMGEAIWWLNMEGGRFPKAIYVMDPRTMEARVDTRQRRIVSWKWNSPDGPIPITTDEIIHFPTWSPMDMYRGRSRWLPLKEELYQTEAAGRVNSALLRNGAVPNGVVSVPGDETGADEVEAILAKWEKRHLGTDRAGRIAVLANGATYAKVSLSPADWQWAEMASWNRETVLARGGMPPAVAGLSKDGTALSGKDTKEQLEQFWRLQLIPEQRFIETKLKSEFFTRFGLALEGRFDNSDIQELQQDAETLHTRLREDVRVGLITINEAREQINLDPVDWGDVAWMPMSVVPVENGEIIEPAAVSSSPPPPEQPPATPPKSLLMVPQRKVLTAEYKAAHWTNLVRGWERIEGGFASKLRGLFGDIGTEVLRILSEKSWQDNIVRALSEKLWQDWGADIKAIGEPAMRQAVDWTGQGLRTLFADMGIADAPAFDIWDTGAVDALKWRVNRITGVVTDTLRNEYRAVLQRGLEEGQTFDDIRDGVKHVREISKTRANTITRTELGGIVNDSRTAAFRDEGFHYHQWGTALDNDVRESHRIDQQVRKIGEPFENGLVYPNDPSGPAEEVINCRCICFPLTDEEAATGEPVTHSHVHEHRKPVREVVKVQAPVAPSRVLNLNVEIPRESLPHKRLHIVRDDKGNMTDVEVTEEEDGE